MRAFAMTGIVTASWIPLMSSGSDMRATPPSRRMSAGTRSSAITAAAPDSSATRACSAVTTSMITPPLSISARPALTRSVPVSFIGTMVAPLRGGTPGPPAKSSRVTRSGTAALTLSEEIRQRFDEFSRSQKDVGQYIVDHLEEVAFHTAEELARRANTSSSTVVRFAPALRFEGFPALQAAARDEDRRLRENGATTEPGPQPPLPIAQTEFEAALAADHANAEETARRVDRDEVVAAVDLLSRAERIVLVGTDQMAFFASYLRHLLMLLDLRAEVVASPSQEGLARLGRIDEGTLVIGFSAGRPHPLVVRAMKLARHRRADTIAICDATLSEVAKLGDQRLYYSSNSPAYVRSHTALLGLIQALAYGVYALDESQYADRIKAFRLK